MPKGHGRSVEICHSKLQQPSDSAGCPTSYRIFVHFSQPLMQGFHPSWVISLRVSWRSLFYFVHCTRKNVTAYAIGFLSRRFLFPFVTIGIIQVYHKGLIKIYLRRSKSMTILRIPKSACLSNALSTLSQTNSPLDNHNNNLVSRVDWSVFPSTAVVRLISWSARAKPLGLELLYIQRPLNHSKEKSSSSSSSPCLRPLLLPASPLPHPKSSSFVISSTPAVSHSSNSNLGASIKLYIELTTFANYYEIKTLIPIVNGIIQ